MIRWLLTRRALLAHIADLEAQVDAAHASKVNVGLKLIQERRAAEAATKELNEVSGMAAIWRELYEQECARSKARAEADGRVIMKLDAKLQRFVGPRERDAHGHFLPLGDRG